MSQEMADKFKTLQDELARAETTYSATLELSRTAPDISQSDVDASFSKLQAVINEIQTLTASQAYAESLSPAQHLDQASFKFGERVHDLYANPPQLLNDMVTAEVKHTAGQGINWAASLGEVPVTDDWNPNDVLSSTATHTLNAGNHLLRTAGVTTKTAEETFGSENQPLGERVSNTKTNLWNGTKQLVDNNADMAYELGCSTALSVLGATVGSVFPGVGTLIGGMIGGAIGGFFGSFVGSCMTNKQFSFKNALGAAALGLIPGGAGSIGAKICTRLCAKTLTGGIIRGGSKFVWNASVKTLTHGATQAVAGGTYGAVRTMVTSTQTGSAYQQELNKNIAAGVVIGGAVGAASGFTSTFIWRAPVAALTSAPVAAAGTGTAQAGAAATTGYSLKTMALVATGGVAAGGLAIHQQQKQVLEQQQQQMQHLQQQLQRQQGVVPASDSPQQGGPQQQPGYPQNQPPRDLTFMAPFSHSYSGLSFSPMMGGAGDTSYSSSSFGAPVVLHNYSGGGGIYNTSPRIGFT